ncbi:hypothetical protein SAY87_006735 [Trapa incisa]|uniref:PRA1 family protein n=2 Tax=Trapa TaxID=22665 RepID=A0AAN7QQ87_TRANT|nr:hypothetical protein SAY87_006735 [Trapa incisa]KAK4774497.1 hypothetical protein SAY86_009432 [Trapa natans]
MTSYGTIPTHPNAGDFNNIEYISRTKDRLRSGLADRRPWTEIFDIRSIRLPSSFTHSLSRAKTNFIYFRANYAILMLLVLFLSLLWHPFSLIVFIIIMAAWLVSYFLRDEPLAFFGRTVDDRLVLIVMAVLTIMLLLLTHATINILVALLVGSALVLAHATARKTDNLFLDEETPGTRGLMTAVECGGSPSST